LRFNKVGPGTIGLGSGWQRASGKSRNWPRSSSDDGAGGNALQEIPASDGHGSSPRFRKKDA
jgi:hypothetical protein